MFISSLHYYHNSTCTRPHSSGTVFGHWPSLLMDFIWCPSSSHVENRVYRLVDQTWLSATVWSCCCCWPDSKLHRWLWPFDNRTFQCSTIMNISLLHKVVPWIIVLNILVPREQARLLFLFVLRTLKEILSPNNIYNTSFLKSNWSNIETYILGRKRICFILQFLLN